jgi:hypothetical protein
MKKRSSNTHIVLNTYTVEVVLICTAFPIHAIYIHIFIVSEKTEEGVLYLTAVSNAKFT